MPVLEQKTKIMCTTPVIHQLLLTQLLIEWPLTFAHESDWILKFLVPIIVVCSPLVCDQPRVVALFQLLGAGTPAMCATHSLTSPQNSYPNHDPRDTKSLISPITGLVFLLFLPVADQRCCGSPKERPAGPPYYIMSSSPHSISTLISIDYGVPFSNYLRGQ